MVALWAATLQALLNVILAAGFLGASQTYWRPVVSAAAEWVRPNLHILCIATFGMALIATNHVPIARLASQLPTLLKAAWRGSPTTGVELLILTNTHMQYVCMPNTHVVSVGTSGVYR